jgi:hypothetical protein
LIEVFGDQAVESVLLTVDELLKMPSKGSVSDTESEKSATSTAASIK